MGFSKLQNLMKFVEVKHSRKIWHSYATVSELMLKHYEITFFCLMLILSLIKEFILEIQINQEIQFWIQKMKFSVEFKAASEVDYMLTRELSNRFSSWRILLRKHIMKVYSLITQKLWLLLNSSYLI